MALDVPQEPLAPRRKRLTSPMRLVLIVLASSLLSAVCSSAFAGCVPMQQQAPHVTTSNEEETTLGTGDVFDVRVFGEEDLSADYRVAQDGTIDFPLIGRIEVAGLEPGAVATLIQTRLREGQYFVQPHVSVVVREYNSKRVSVLGAVRNPGSYPVRSGMGVVEAIGLAGGFTALANRDGTTITRSTSGEIHRYAAPIDRITDGQEEDIPLRAGDIIRVPERLF
ncbi:MAG: polysaccharide biosynthesis/export family protein [Sandaracinus sp.]